jgi:hypothetical protein
MVVLIVYHDLDNEIHNHWIFPLVENIHRNKDHIVVNTMNTLAFHDENMLAVAMVLVNET